MFDPKKYNMKVAINESIASRLKYAIDDIKSHSNFMDGLDIKFKMFGPTAVGLVIYNGVEQSICYTVQMIEGQYDLQNKYCNARDWQSCKDYGFIEWNGNIKISSKYQVIHAIIKDFNQWIKSS